MQKTRFSQKLSNLVISIDDLGLYEVVHAVFKEPITGPLKFKTAEIRHFGS